MRPGSNSDGNGAGSVDLDIDLDLGDDPAEVHAAPTAHAIAEAIVSIQENGPPPSSPPIDLKKLSQKNWIVNLMIAVLVAGAGAIAAYKATESRSLENHSNVEKNSKAIDGNRRAITDVGIKVDKGREEQAILIKGVEALKQEARTDKQKRLEEKVLELERINRRLERENR